MSKPCVSAASICAALKHDLIGPDVAIDGPANLKNLQPGKVVFAKEYSPELAQTLNSVEKLFVIASDDFGGKLTASHVLSKKPRLDFARLLELFFERKRSPVVETSARVSATAILGKNSSVGQHTVIEDEVLIGDDCEIHHNVVIAEGSIVGNRVRIKSNTVIGEKGFGFEYDDNGIPKCIPHVGRVIIGNNVEIGALCTVVRGTVGDTVVGDHVKTDDHVHIAHNVTIGEGTLLTAAVEISGSVVIGSRVWIGPQAAIIDGISVGDEAVIGIGAVVRQDVQQRAVVVGNPARLLRYRSFAHGFGI